MPTHAPKWGPPRVRVPYSMRDGRREAEAAAWLDLSVGPTLATLAISTLLKAGESVCQPLLWTKTVFHALRGAQPLFHAIFGVKTLSGTL